MSAGKGDSPRPYDGDKFRTNWDKVFGHKEEQVVRAAQYEPSTSDRIYWGAIDAYYRSLKNKIKRKVKGNGKFKMVIELKDGVPVDVYSEQEL